ncbi:hypothetical protein [Nocardioides sp. MH1]|uniref:hypothetical protein n=1 Tax=Nocardioides sp. MH1 TaxID=3242490 RepID=UPI0035223474
MDVRLAARLTPSLTGCALVAWVVAVVLLLPAGNVTAIVIVRTLLCMGFLVFLTRVMVRRAYAGAGLLPAVLVSAVVSYALFPPAWVGRGLLAQAVVDPGWVTALLDAILWVAVVVVAARTTEPQDAPLPYQPYQQA